MATQQPSPQVSAFMTTNLPVFFDLYGVSFCVDGPQLEYFVFEKKYGVDISCSLTLSFDPFGSQIKVMTFYPGIYLHPGSRYLSAVCFFLVLQHFANFHHVAAKACRICLHTKQPVFDNFYALLKDFDFHVLLHGEDGYVDIESSFLALGIDTSMILERALVDY